MLESSTDSGREKEFQNGELRIRGDQAHGFYNQIHLLVVPAPFGGSGFHVFFTEDNVGKPDFSKVKNSLAIDGNIQDLAEIADMFMRRLTSEVPLENMFQDFQEQNRKKMEELYEQFKDK